MSDYISKAAAIEAVVGVTIYKTRDEIRDYCERYLFDANGWLGGINDAIESIEELPAADVVEVVRCKDCRYLIEHNYDDCVKKYTCRWSGIYQRQLDDYCSLAERREDG